MKLTLKERIGYGFGDMASSMFWKLFGMYLLFFYTDVFGISAAAVGTMFLVTRIWDALNDPLMGVLADRTITRWGKFRPYLLWMAIPFGVIGILTFTTPDLPVFQKLIYAYVTYTLMMMIYTAINVPYASLLGVMTPDTRERTTLSSYRMFFAYLGSFLALMMIEPLVSFFSSRDNGNEKIGWTLSVSVIASICVMLFLCCFWLTRERVKPIAEKRNSLKHDFSDLSKNRPWFILLGAGVAALIFNSIRDGATIYYFKYYIQATETAGMVKLWGSTFTLTSLYFMIGQAANMLGVALSAPVANRIGKKMTYLFFMVLATLLSIAFYWLTPAQLPAIFVMQALISICAGSIFPLLWSMYADVADYSEWKCGRRATGLIFSSSSMSQKFGWTIGGALTGWLLGYFGFEANIAQSGAVIEGLKLMLSIIPAVGTVLSIVFILMYPLSEKKMSNISEELKAQRQRTQPVFPD